MEKNKTKNKRWYWGMLGFLGFLGVPEVLTQDWLGSLWLLWFLWFLYFIPNHDKTRLRSGEELRRGEGGDNVTNEERVEENEVNLTRTLDLFNSDNHITNNDVEKALGVSNTSAERYLDELEGRGKIEQVGETGRGVVYKLKV